MELEFINGKATIKKGRKILAKIFDRPVFYPLNKINSGYSLPYQLEITGLGIRECKDLAEVEEMILKYI